YAFSDSLLLTPLCCNDIRDVTPPVSAFAGCDNSLDVVFDGAFGGFGDEEVVAGEGLDEEALMEFMVE
ncbi:hypothetical protein Tco_0854301, partial [Tanacetum coccineum]